MRCSGNALCTFDEYLAIRLQSKCHRILHGNMYAMGIHTKIDRIDDVFDDLSKCQRNDRQIISL